MTALPAQQLERRHQDGALFVDGLHGSRKQRLRLAEQRVAWTGTDNLNLPRAAASDEAALAGLAFVRGESYTLGPYTFTIVEVPGAST